MTYYAPNLPKEKHGFFGRNGVDKSFEKPINKLNQNISFSKAIFITEATDGKIIADGAVTTNKNILLAVKAADCAPVLFIDPENQLIGASHAGWQGALEGVLENTLDLMVEHGAKVENIRAAIGPCLQQKSFEVREDLYEKFNAPEFFKPLEPGRYLFDLESYVESRLKKYGVKDISKSGIDTYTNEETYNSYRRDTHRKIAPTVSQLSVIGL